MNKFLLSFFFCLFAISSTYAQSAEEIIQKHLDRTGGENNWRNLYSIILKGEVILGLQDSYLIVVHHKRPFYKRVDFIVNGQKLLNEGYDGKKAWTYNDLAKKNVEVPGYSPEPFDSDLLIYQRKGFIAAYLGKEEVEGKESYKVLLTKNNNKITYYFDVNTYDLLMEENKEEKLVYSDFKEIKGLVFAMKVVGKPVNGGEYILRFTEIQTNPPIENKLFKF